MQPVDRGRLSVQPHTPDRIARDGLDMIRLMRCVEGAVWWRVEEREFAQRPGDIVVTGFSRPDQMRARELD